MAFEAFAATKLWREVQSEFRAEMREMSLGRWLRSGRGEIFSGAQAATVAEKIFRGKRDRLRHDVTREKAVKICICWLKEGFILPAQAQEPPLQFRDASNAFYRLSEEEEVAESESLSPALLRAKSLRLPSKSGRNPAANQGPSSLNRKQTQRGGKAELSSSPFPPRPQSSRLLFTPQRVHPNVEDVQMRSPTPRRLRTTPQMGTTIGDAEDSGEDEMEDLSTMSGLTVDTSTSASASFCLEEMDEEAVHDAALFRLLTLVEVPILDGILHIKEDQAESRRRRSGGGGLLERLMDSLALGSRSSSSSTPQTSSSRSLSFCPTPLVVEFRKTEAYGLAFEASPHLSANELDAELCKALSTTQALAILHQHLLSSFRHRRDLPLIPNRLENLVMEVGKRVWENEEALQLLLLLLPYPRRRQLQSLCAFLHHLDGLIAQGRGPQGLEWEGWLKKDWAQVLFPACSGWEERGKLGEWLVRSGAEAWRVPLGLREELQSGGDGEEARAGHITYCQRVSQAEFQEQKENKTDRELIAQASVVLNDLTRSYNDRRNFFRSFQKVYPHLALEHFSTWSRQS